MAEENANKENKGETSIPPNHIAPGIINYTSVLRIPVKLDSKNWSSWSLFVERGLMSIDKKDHLTENPPDPITKIWQIDDSGIQMALWNAMEPQILSIAQNFSTVKEMWNHLSSSFSAKQSLSHAFSVVQAYNRIEQGDSTFTDYFTRFSKLRDELRVLYPPTTDLKLQEERNTKMDIMTFIAGLSPKYASARPLLLSNPAATTSVASTYHLLREMYNSETVSGSTDTSAMRTVSSSVGKTNDRSSQVPFKKGVGRGGSIKCHYCHQDGHTKYNCPNRPPGSLPPPRPKAKIAVNDELPDGATSTDGTTPSYTLSQEEYRRVQHLLTPQANSAKSGTGNEPADWHRI